MHGLDTTPGVTPGHKPPAVKEMHILCITAGLSCDGDSVSTTAATLPSLEDVILGAVPNLPKVHLHNPVLAFLCSLFVGVGVGLLIGFAAHMAWLGIVLGFAAMIVTGFISGWACYHGDFKR